MPEFEVCLAKPFGLTMDPANAEAKTGCIVCEIAEVGAASSYNETVPDGMPQIQLKDEIRGACEDNNKAGSDNFQGKAYSDIIRSIRKMASPLRITLFRAPRADLAEMCSIPYCGSKQEDGALCKHHCTLGDTGESHGLTVFVMSATRLAKRGDHMVECTLTMSEGGVEAQIGEREKKRQTNIQMKSGGPAKTEKSTDPIWGEAFNFPFFPMGKNCRLTLTLCDWNGGKVKRVLGEVLIPHRVMKAAIIGFHKTEFDIEGVDSRWYPAQGGVDAPSKPPGLHVLLAPMGVAITSIRESLLDKPCDLAAQEKRQHKKQKDKDDEDRDAEAEAAREREESQLTMLQRAAKEKTYSDEKIQKMGVARARVRQEIIETETTYVEALRILQHEYVMPVKIQGNKTGIETVKQAALCSNIETLHPLHVNFLESLKSGGLEELAQTMLDFSSLLNLYTTYMTGYPQLLAAMSDLRKSSKRFSTFLDAVELKVFEHGLVLTSYLIQPVQRVPRYVLLLQELLDKTLTTDPSFETLRQALEKIRRVAMAINEGARDAEAMTKLMAIQNRLTGCTMVLLEAHRRLVREGEFKVLQSKGLFGSMKASQRLFLLFNDILLWTTPKHTYKGHCALAALKLDKACSGGALAFQIESSVRETLIVQCKDQTEFDTWFEELNRVIQECRARIKQARENRKKGRNRGANGRGAGGVHNLVSASLADLSNGIIPDDTTGGTMRAGRKPVAGVKHDHSATLPTKAKAGYKVRTVARRR